MNFHERPTVTMVYISDQFIKTSTPTRYVENWCYNRKYHLPYNLFALRNVIA